MKKHTATAKIQVIEVSAAELDRYAAEQRAAAAYRAHESIRANRAAAAALAEAATLADEARKQKSAKARAAASAALDKALQYMREGAGRAHAANQAAAEQVRAMLSKAGR